MSTNARLKALERAAHSAAADLAAALPPGLTVYDADQARLLWARLAADYSARTGCELDAALEATKAAAAAILAEDDGAAELEAADVGPEAAQPGQQV